MSSIKDQIITLVKQRHHSHKVALEQEKDPRSKHAIDLIARIREDSRLIEVIDSLPDEDLYAEVGDTEEDYIKRSIAKVNECRKMICKDSLQVPETCKEDTDSLTSDLDENNRLHQTEEE